MNNSMEVTIEEALRQGIAAHREGKVQDAERLYRTILGSQPTHPDANHNLGVLAVGVGKVDVSLPHFKVAVESNPKIEQYWLSYVNALIKLGRNEDARQVLQQGRDTGLKGDKLDQLEAQLIDGASQDAVSPGQEQLDGLIALYNKGELQEVLVQGNALSSQFPEDEQSTTAVVSSKSWSDPASAFSRLGSVAQCPEACVQMSKSGLKRVK